MADWFEGYHEFHLSLDEGDGRPAIHVWDYDQGTFRLDRQETLDLYRACSSILTDYLSTMDFRHIYPWHHAAGDFVVKRTESGIEVKLITARDYRPVLPDGLPPDDPWIGIVYFFFNLTLRMRLDRLDGTGDLVWAPKECLRAVVEGFLRSWQDKHEQDSSLPSPRDVLDVLCSLDEEEWHCIGEAIMSAGIVEREEIPFLESHFEEHLVDLRRALT